MKNTFCFPLMMLSLLACIQMTPIATANEEIQLQGVELGKPTMDYDAAKKLAKEKKLAILLDFNGSDWDMGSMSINEEVFSKKAWQDYAADKLIRIVIDFPRNPNKVPAAYKERNEALKNAFKVKGFPTYVILASDGKTELSRVTAENIDNPNNFQKLVAEILKAGDPEIIKYRQKIQYSQRMIKKYQRLMIRHQEMIAECQEKLKQLVDAGKNAEGNNNDNHPYGERLDTILVDMDGEEVETKLLDNNFVIVYYSAGWCPPCQRFTPGLVDFYNQHHKNGQFELVFYSFDRKKEAMHTYMKGKKMPFPAIKFESLEDSKMKQFAGRGIPFLVLFDKKGEVLVREGAFSAMPKIKNIIAKAQESQ